MISDLNITALFNMLKGCSFYNPAHDITEFLESSNMDHEYIIFRTKPIEYYNFGTNFAVLISHKATFSILNAMQKIYKLNEFEQTINLSNILNSVINTQFLQNDQPNFGGFFPRIRYSIFPSNMLNNYVSIEYSYYAIKILNLLAENLNLESISNLILDLQALYTYISRYVVETSDTLFIKYDSSNFNQCIRHTYYMIYILKSLEMYSLDNFKVENYISSNLQYNNIENLYYCFKIDELLNLGYDFNLTDSQLLINKSFCHITNEFFINKDKQELQQDSILWIMEMAKNDKFHLECEYDNEIYLDSFFRIRCIIRNLVISDYGTYTMIKFESDTLGNFLLTKGLDDWFYQEIHVPMDYDYYPYLDGYLRIYEGTMLKFEQYIFIQTQYILDLNPEFFLYDFYWKEFLTISSSSIVIAIIPFLIIKVRKKRLH
jgi:hypothetical protein